MTADERLALIRLKIDRANTHILELEEAKGEFLSRSICEIKIEDDPKTGQKLFRFTRLSDPPSYIGIIAGDAIHCLRSALDHLAHQLVLVNGQHPSDKTCFPIMRSESAFKPHHVQRVEGMSQAAKDEVLTTRLYKESNDTLWLIHKLDIADKHRSLLTTMMWLPEIALSRHMTQGDYSVPDRPLEEGRIFFSCKSEGHEDVKFIFDIALGEAGIFKDYPIVGALKTMLDVVDSLIIDFRPLLG